jgi:hypothetical protein
VREREVLSAPPLTGASSSKGRLMERGLSGSSPGECQQKGPSLPSHSQGVGRTLDSCLGCEGCPLPEGTSDCALEARLASPWG